MEKKLFLLVLIFLFQNYFLSISYGQLVVINEICTSPPGGSTTNSNSLYNTAELPSDNQEWIELYNPNPCNSIDISCYTIGGNMLQTYSGTVLPNWGAFTFPSGTVIPPASFIIVGGNSALVPILEFNTTDYRQTSFGVQYLDGDPTRWFLRDEYGWVGLYDPSGTVVDAVYWDAYGNASNLFAVTEYQQNIVTQTTCNGTQTLTAARYISGIEYVGASIASSYLSFQRETDGSLIWKNGPSSPTPHACNGPCAAAPQLSFVVQNENCNMGNGSISMTITDGHTGPYTTNWLNPSGVHSNTITNLSAGTYIVQVVDAYNCFIVYDTVIIINTPGPSVTIDSVTNDMCTASDGSVYIHVIGGAQPFSYLWNSNPAQTTQNLTGVQAGNYSVTATDANGCKAFADTILADTSPPIIVVDQIISDTCNKCIGSIHITATGGNPPYFYGWSTDSSDIADHITDLSQGNYVVSVTDNFCSSTASVKIDNIPGPRADFRFYPPVATIDNPTFRFEDWSTGIIDHWYWDFGDYSNSNTQEPMHTYGAVGNFDVMLKISNNHGCVDSIIKEVIVVDRPSLYIPNCFTPNGDGINDYFYVNGTNITDITMYIYNRWGELVFTSNSIDDKWNGKYKGDKVILGVYNYVIFYKEDFGGVMLRQQTRSGQVTVLL